MRKTTLLRAIMGLLPVWRGSVRLDDREVARVSAHEKAQLGLVLVPEGRQLFSTMTVAENLEMGATARRWADVQLSLAVSDFAYVLDRGKVGIEGPAREVRQLDAVRKAYLGLW